MSENSAERIQSFQEGEIIIQEGDPGECAYVIHHGKVEVSKYLLGSKQILGVLEKGDFFGEISLITKCPRTATVKALEDVQLMEMNWPTFQKRVSEHSFLAVKVIRSLVERLAKSLNTKEEVTVELERKSHEIHEKNHELEEAARQRDHFFQTVSHELRTPLTLILGPLEEEFSTQPDSTNINLALINTYRLIRMVNHALDIQLFSSGSQDIEVEPINITEFLEVCGQYFREICEDRDASVTMTFNGEPWEETALEDIYIQGDAGCLEKIIFNYLSNALKFTEKNTEIEIGLLEWNKAVRVYVRDNGPGIHPDHVTEIFKRFTPIDDGSAQKHEGSGIGLALVQDLAKAMRANVGVDTLLGEGSTFYYECESIEAPETESISSFEVKPWMLADVLEHNPAEQDDPHDGDDAQFDGLDVLVIDDLSAMRTFIGRTLERLGCKVYSARNGREGLDLALTRTPDLIITDWVMDDMTGPELITRLRTSAFLDHSKIILLTAKTDEESRLIGQDIGANIYLGKPFSNRELTSSVKNLLELRRCEAALEDVALNQKRENLKRNLAPALVEVILNSPDGHFTEPRDHDVTILCANLNNFHEQTTTLEAAEKARILRDYLSCMRGVIFANSGTVDKFIADTLVVIFGAPVAMTPQEQVQHATRCSAQMRDALENLNQAWLEDGIAEFQLRVGMDYAEATVGDFGTDEHSDYTAIGPPVEGAAQLATLCEPGEIYGSEALIEHLPESWSHEEVGDEPGETTLYRLILDK